MISERKRLKRNYKHSLSGPESVLQNHRSTRALQQTTMTLHWIIIIIIIISNRVKKFVVTRGSAKSPIGNDAALNSTKLSTQRCCQRDTTVYYAQPRNIPPWPATRRLLRMWVLSRQHAEARPAVAHTRAQLLLLLLLRWPAALQQRQWMMQDGGGRADRLAVSAASAESPVSCRLRPLPIHCIHSPPDSQSHYIHVRSLLPRCPPLGRPACTPAVHWRLCTSGTTLRERLVRPFHWVWAAAGGGGVTGWSRGSTGPSR